jgi:DNA adenine methylase
MGIMRYTSPLRYPGGKNKLKGFIGAVFAANHLLGGDYVEPYAGGASIAFHLLFGGYAGHVHINDLNRSLYAFWSCVLQETEDLCRLINDTRVNMSIWHNQKHIQENPCQFSALELGFSTFFLNRTNRSGIIKGGVIGGKTQHGPFLLDARFNKPTLISRIKKIAEYKDQISIYNLDATDFILQVLPGLPARTLVYLDPPYYMKGCELYENHYQKGDHAALAKVVAGINQKWIISYDDALEIRTLYAKYRNLDYGLSYSAAFRYRGSEVMFFCDDMIIPVESSPRPVGSHRVTRHPVQCPPQADGRQM